MNVALVLARSASIAPNAPALAHGEKVLLDYAGLWRRVAMLSHGLGRYAAPGDRIVLAMANSPDYLVVMFAALHRGLVLVPVNSALQVREVEHCIADSGAVLCFTDAHHFGGLKPLEDRIASLKAVVDIDSPAFEQFICERENSAPISRAARDPAWIFYTSGTTGRPKGATLSHGNLRAMIAAQHCDFGTPPNGGCLIHHAPLSHGSGLLAMSFVASGTLQVIPGSQHRDADGVLGLASHWGKASLFSAPTFLNRIVAAASADSAKAEGIHTIFFGGAPMYVEDLARALRVLGPRLSQLYGQGESPMTICGVPADAYAAAEGDRLARLMASVGWVRSGVEIAILDEAGNTVTDGQPGMVAVRGDVVMTGYWNMPEADAVTLVEGWLQTGDIGILDEYGLLSLVDRAKDVIISGGLNIYPREVEEILLSNESVAEVSVIGIPDSDWGEIVVAAVVARNDCAIETDELDAICLDNIARFKRPKKYVLMDELPKSAYGKILKREVIRIISSNLDTLQRAV